MPDQETTQFFANEGELPFIDNDTENDTSAASSTEKNKKEKTQSDGGGNTSSENNIPFNEDPKVQDYLKRQNDKLLAEAEGRYQKKLEEATAKIREDIGTERKKEMETKLKREIPLWFGGDKSQYNPQQLQALEKQWEEYLRHEDTRIAEAEERAFKRVSEAKTTQEKLEAEATNYLQSEMLAIESDKSLSPQGFKFSKESAEELLAIVMDTAHEGKYPLIDAQGRWNYRAGAQIYFSKNKSAGIPNQQTQQKKKIAGATNSDNRGGENTPTVPGSKDFRGKSWGDL